MLGGEPLWAAQEGFMAVGCQQSVAAVHLACVSSQLLSISAASQRGLGQKCQGWRLLGMATAAGITAAEWGTRTVGLKGWALLFAAI